MTEEVPKNYGFLKFIVIFMGVLIALGLAVVVWKVIDLAQQKAAREQREAVRQEQMTLPRPADRRLDKPFEFDLALESDERILETAPTPAGLWLRIGRGGITERMILVDFSGKVVGSIQVKHNDATHSVR